MGFNKSYSVLIVCSNRECLILIKEYIDKMGIFAEFDFAFEGEEACEKINENCYDLLITELIMPKIDGFVILEHCAKLSHLEKLKKVVLSSVCNDFLLKKAFERELVIGIYENK